MKYQFICQYCKRNFVDNNYVKKRTFCSSICNGKAQIKLRKTKLFFTCNECNKEFLNKNWLKSRLFCSTICAKKSKLYRQKIRESRLGEKSHLWKGGVSDINKRIRAGFDFRNWRESVFRRDNWTCQQCYQKGGRLHPHHLKSFASYPELRFELTNGQTLCEDCHHKTDTWGRPSVKQTILKYL